MRNSLKTTKITGITLLIIGVLIIGSVVYASIAATPGITKKTPSATPVPSSTPTDVPHAVDGDTTKDILIVSVDTDKSVIWCYEPESNMYLDLKYSGATDIKSKFGQTISARILEKGTIAEVSYDKADGKLYHLYLSADYWHYEKPLIWDLDLAGGMMRVGSINYHVSADVPTFAPDGEYDPKLLSEMDVINVIGKGTYVFGLELVYGHGTLYAMNEKDYIGGSLFVDNVYAGQITEGFMMSIREGNYEISYSLGELNGKQEISMNRNGTVVVDMSPAVDKNVEYGYVDFSISPSGADLFIDNKFYQNHVSVKLAYGQHVVEVSVQGYSTWTGLITVNSEKMNFNVQLVRYFVPTPTPTAEPFFEVPTPTPDPNATPTPTPDPNVTLMPTSTPAPTEDPNVTPTLTPTGNPDVTPTLTPTPGPDATPVPSPTPTPNPGAETLETVIVWYPKAIITVDSVYVGQTNDAGEITVKMDYGKHVLGAIRLEIDGVTPPKTYTIEVSEATPARIKLPTTDISE